MPHNSSQHRVVFRRKLFRFYERHGRDLPWRTTTDPYCVTVSELMLQQTQVERVVLKYRAWIRRWPNWQSLANATTRELLAQWSGLGYNRRALYLGEMARVVTHDLGGVMPREILELERLPGIGRYTARAILIFAHNEPIVAVDTNIRRVLRQEFGLSQSATTAQIESLAESLLPRRRSRDWHNALMDYSRIMLPKRLGSNQTARRQARFVGSRRQVRGEIIRQLTEKKSVTLSQVAARLTRSTDDVLEAAQGLQKDGLITLRGKTIRLSER